MNATRFSAILAPNVMTYLLTYLLTGVPDNVWGPLNSVPRFHSTAFRLTFTTAN